MDAQRMTNVIRAPFQTQLNLGSRLPQDPEDEQWRMEGLEPEVQLFNGAVESKISPNYSDYLALKEDEHNQAISRRTGPPDVMDILREAYPEV